MAGLTLLKLIPKKTGFLLYSSWYLLPTNSDFIKYITAICVTFMIYKSCLIFIVIGRKIISSLQEMGGDIKRLLLVITCLERPES